MGALGWACNLRATAIGLGLGSYCKFLSSGIICKLYIFQNVTTKGRITLSFVEELLLLFLPLGFYL